MITTIHDVILTELAQKYPHYFENGRVIQYSTNEYTIESRRCELLVEFKDSQIWISSFPPFNDGIPYSSETIDISDPRSIDQLYAEVEYRIKHATSRVTAIRHLPHVMLQIELAVRKPLCNPVSDVFESG